MTAYKCNRKRRNVFFNGTIFKELSMVFAGNKTPERKLEESHKTITSADFEIDEKARLVCVSVVGKFGRFSDARRFWREEIDFQLKKFNTRL